MIITVTLNPVLDRTLTVPSIVFDRVLRATKIQLDWGGKGFNVSRALKSLGIDSLAMGLVGGATGQMLERGLYDLGIATDLIRVVGETRTNVVVVDSNTGQHLKVNEAGPMVHPQELQRLMERVCERVRPGDIWVLSGSIPPGVPSDVYARLIALVQQGGARAVLDSSGEPLRLGCVARPFLVKPNAVEAEEMVGRAIATDAGAMEAARSFLEQGIELVALSLGVDGLLLASGREAVRAVPPPVQARNAVGAGDALLAGVIWALEQNRPMEEVARWGVATGTAAAMREGVRAGSRAEVERAYEGTNVWAMEGPAQRYP
jgi:1-phosphofructokinase family hexose kinase